MRSACDQVNNEMLENLDADIVRLEAVDSIDETKSNPQWSKKAQTELERLNKDCNLTAGLEAVLYLAEGARVMLRRTGADLGGGQGGIAPPKILIDAILLFFD